MRLFDESVEEHFLLLTFSWWLPWIQCKQMEDADWWSGVFWIIRKMTLVETCWYEANELIFAELWEFHACRKRGKKTGYQSWYRDNSKSELILPLSGRIGPEFWPGNVASSWLMLMKVQDIWTFEKVVFVSLSWVTLEAQVSWSHLFAILIWAWFIIKVGILCIVNFYSYSWSELTAD